MRALQFSDFGPVSNLRLVELPDPKADAATAIVKVAAGAISPSDVKNVEGAMEHTTLPRVPGRDYAGTVIYGPGEWIGTEVWGTGGEIGYSVDGSHAELMAVPVASLRRKPKTLSFEQAAAIGVTYLAAWLGVVEYAQLAPGETLLVIGAGGDVGGLRHKSGNGAGPVSSGLTNVNSDRMHPRHARWTISASSAASPSIPLSRAQRTAAVHRSSSTRSAAPCLSRG